MIAFSVKFLTLHLFYEPRQISDIEEAAIRQTLVGLILSFLGINFAIGERN